MEPLSRNKKIGLVSLLVFCITVSGLFFTGIVDFSFLQSNVLNSCTVESQEANLPMHQKRLDLREKSYDTIQIVSGEVVKARQKIGETQNTIRQKQAQLAKVSAQIKDLTIFIDKNCKGAGNKTPICQNKRIDLKNLTQDREIIKNSISIAQNTLIQLQNQMTNYQRNITQQNDYIARLTKFINQYEACERQLNIKPFLTSPMMSGEARMSGETLVSGEVCMSSEVLISGEVHVSGEVNVPVYRFSVSQYSSVRTEIDSMQFYLSALDKNSIQVSDWFIAEENLPNILYKCSYVDPNSTQLQCLPGIKSSLSYETKNYVLYARVRDVTGTGSFKVYSAHIAYNGNKADVINETTALEIQYTDHLSCNKSPFPDFELRRLVPGIEFGPINTDLDKKYFFGTEVCVHGPLSINDLKKTHAQLVNGFPLGYTIFGANGATVSRVFTMGGWVENLKNGQCAPVMHSIQNEDQSFFDKAQRIAFTLDHENIVQEINENNNAKELSLQQVTCTDSDNTYAVSTGNGGINNLPGLDRNILGTVKYQSETYTDYCATQIMYSDGDNNLVRYDRVPVGEYIMEQACLNGKEQYLTTPYKCPNGCSNGACIKDVQQKGSLYVIVGDGVTLFDDADISINGVSYGNSKYRSISLVPGKYTLSVKKPGYAPWAQDIEISSKNIAHAFVILNKA